VPRRTIFGILEFPPPLEFFLVRTSGAFMWFAVAFCLMMAPALAQEPGPTGYLMSLLVSVPILWVMLFLVAAYSWHQAESAGRVGLKEMYRSNQFTKFVWWTQCGLATLAVAGLIILGRHPDFLIHLF
jgi:hypothetical protein